MEIFGGVGQVCSPERLKVYMRLGVQNVSIGHAKLAETVCRAPYPWPDLSRAGSNPLLSCPRRGLKTNRFVAADVAQASRVIGTIGVSSFFVLHFRDGSDPLRQQVLARFVLGFARRSDHRQGKMN
jgi:hypothetical protein